jgi:hypothetical protein
MERRMYVSRNWFSPGGSRPSRLPDTLAWMAKRLLGGTLEEVTTEREAIVFDDTPDGSPVFKCDYEGCDEVAVVRWSRDPDTILLQDAASVCEDCYGRFCLEHVEMWGEWKWVPSGRWEFFIGGCLCIPCWERFGQQDQGRNSGRNSGW